MGGFCLDESTKNFCSVPLLSSASWFEQCQSTSVPSSVSPRVKNNRTVIVILINLWLVSTLIKVPCRVVQTTDTGISFKSAFNLRLLSPDTNDMGLFMISRERTRVWRNLNRFDYTIRKFPVFVHLYFGEPDTIQADILGFSHTVVAKIKTVVAIKKFL